MTTNIESLVTNYISVMKHDRLQLTREFIARRIAYEQHAGIHTYHDCKCGRSITRAGICPDCWRDIYKQVYGTVF